MINSGKCQKCEKVINSVSIGDIDIKDGLNTIWRGISYCCPFCKSVISVQIDPAILKAEIIDGVVEKLRK